jgi:hypothetical protein
MNGKAPDSQLVSGGGADLNAHGPARHPREIGRRVKRP